MSRDESCLIARTDQLLVVRNSHTIAENSKLCASRDERYLISRTDQLSVVRKAHTTAAQNNRLGVSSDEGCLFRRPDRRRWCGQQALYEQRRRLCEQRRRLPYFANQPAMGGVELSYHSTEQQALCEQRRRLRYFANQPVIGGAERSHHSSTEQQASCEQRRKLPYFTRRTDVGGAELSHRSTDLQEQRARIPHFRASQKSIDRVEGSNQNDCLTVQHSRYPTEAERKQWKYMYRSEQTDGPRRQGQVEPPVQQPEVSTLAPVDAWENGRSARSRLPYGETRRRKSTERMVQKFTIETSDLDKKASTRKRRAAVQASQHLHSHDPRKTRSRGRRSSTDRSVLGITTDRPRTHTALLQRSKRRRGSG